MEQLKNMNSSLENDKTLGELFFPDDKEMAATYVALVESSFYLNRNFLGVFLNHFLPNFENAAIAHFTKFPIIDDLQQPFINSLTPFWKKLIKNQQYAQSQILWENVLSMVERISEHFHHRIHKGAIFYYWGISAILNGELEKGYRLMGEALVEDIKTYKNKDPDTPAYKFVHFDYKDKNQNFCYYLNELRNIWVEYLENYKNENSSKLDDVAIQKRFLLNHPNSECVLLLNYSLARIKQLSSIKNTPDNFLAGILDQNLLFDLTLVIDLSLKPRTGNFGLDISNLWKKINPNMCQEKLQQINGAVINNFYSGISSLLSRQFTDSDLGKLNSIECDIAITYVIRNHSAHNIDPNLILPIKSYSLIRSIFNVLFFVIDSQY